MKWRVKIGSGIGYHLDLANLKFDAWRVVLLRGFATEVVADDGSGEAFVGDDSVGGGVAEVDEGGHGSGNIVT